MNQDWYSILLNWLPLIALIVVWIILRRGVGASSTRTLQLYEVHVAEIQRTNALLERVAAALEKKADK